MSRGNFSREETPLLAAAAANKKFTRRVVFEGGSIISWFNLKTCSEVIENGAIGQNTCDFLLVFYSNFRPFYSNFGPISYHFCATVDFMPK